MSGEGVTTGRSGSTIDRIECSRCDVKLDPSGLVGVCTCGAPLLARYRFAEAGRTLTPSSLGGRRTDMWRYAEVLPSGGPPVTLGEGMTPLVEAPAVARELGLAWVGVKDEAVNPTGSFKARGLSAAVTMAAERGVTRAAMPSAGNAASALAAYGARAGMEVDIYLPADTPRPFLSEVRLHGAHLHLVDGTIADCGRVMREENASAANSRRFDFSTLREPYRIEGKKTLMYELWEQTCGELVDAIVYPTGGGTGLIGMWKAVGEIRELGWPMGKIPRMISVQAEGCAPIVEAYRSGAGKAAPWKDPRTVASGLRVPAALGDFLILAAVRESGGTAIAVSDDELLAGARRLASTAGVLACPEGGATLAALERCVEQGSVRKGERVVIFNTGSGLKYLDRLDPAAGEEA